MLTSTSQPHKINSFYTSPGEAHCIQIGRKPQEQRRLNADIIETTRNSVLPSSEINSGSRETPVCKISKLLQMLQNVARCCKVEYLSKMKYENRETTTIELSVVDCPRKGENPFSEIICNVADAPVLAIAAETRYRTGAQRGVWLCCMQHEVGRVALITNPRTTNYKQLELKKLQRQCYHDARRWIQESPSERWDAKDQAMKKRTSYNKRSKRRQRKL